jgi:hypothetical protein
MILNLFVEKMIFNWYMLSLRVLNRVFREINNIGIVTHDGDRLFAKNLNIFEIVFNPQHLSTIGCCGYIFIFSCRERNGSLFLTDPGH